MKKEGPHSLMEPCSKPPRKSAEPCNTFLTGSTLPVSHLVQVEAAALERCRTCKDGKSLAYLICLMGSDTAVNPHQRRMTCPTGHCENYE